MELDGRNSAIRRLFGGLFMDWSNLEPLAFAPIHSESTLIHSKTTPNELARVMTATREGLTYTQIHSHWTPIPLSNSSQTLANTRNEPRHTPKDSQTTPMKWAKFLKFSFFLRVCKSVSEQFASPLRVLRVCVSPIRVNAGSLGVVCESLCECPLAKHSHEIPES